MERGQNLSPNTNEGIIILTTETTDEAIEKLYNEFVKEFKKDPKIYEVNLPAYIEECRVELENEIKI